jgi:hypothetical protein
MDSIACCSTTETRCALDAKDQNKEVDTVLHLFHMYLGTSVQHCCVHPSIQWPYSPYQALASSLEVP